MGRFWSLFETSWARFGSSWARFGAPRMACWGLIVLYSHQLIDLSSFQPAAPQHLTSRPGGLREAIKSAAPWLAKARSVSNRCSRFQEWFQEVRADCRAAHLAPPSPSKVRSWASFSPILAYLGAFLPDLGPILAHLALILGHLGSLLAHLGAFLVSSWRHFGPSWPNLGPSSPHLGSSWRHLGPTSPQSSNKRPQSNEK